MKILWLQIIYFLLIGLILASVDRAYSDRDKDRLPQRITLEEFHQNDGGAIVSGRGRFVYTRSVQAVTEEMIEAEAPEGIAQDSMAYWKAQYRRMYSVPAQQTMSSTNTQVIDLEFERTGSKSRSAPKNYWFSDSIATIARIDIHAAKELDEVLKNPQDLSSLVRIETVWDGNNSSSLYYEHGRLSDSNTIAGPVYIPPFHTFGTSHGITDDDSMMAIRSGAMTLVDSVTSNGLVELSLSTLAFTPQAPIYRVEILLDLQTFMCHGMKRYVDNQLVEEFRYENYLSCSSGRTYPRITEFIKYMPMNGEPFAHSVDRYAVVGTNLTLSVR